jgi:RND family efflux transporter MFP subunit
MRLIISNKKEIMLQSSNMKKKIHSVREFFKTHRLGSIVGSIVILGVLFFVFKGHSNKNLSLIEIKKEDLKQTILATGQVTSTTELDLSFSSTGIVSRLNVVVGSKVAKGQVLAMIDNGDEYAALKTAEAKYQKVVSGSSNEEVAVAQAQLDSAKANLANAQKTQETLVSNARRALLNTDLAPISSENSTGSAPSVTGIYTGSEEGSYTITPQSSGSTGYFTFTGIESGTGNISTTAPVALGTKGLYIQFPANYSTSTWTVALPNKKSSSYLADYNAYLNAEKNRDSAISEGEAKVNEAQANLNLKKAAARPADVSAAEAEVEQARATYAKTLLVAPTSGTVTHVDTKVGERADASKGVITLENISDLYVEAKINETSIAKVILDQPVAMTLDAFGPDVLFTGNVIHIDPSATTEDGVVNYLIKTSITDPTGLHIVRPGMNANMLITAWDHSGVLTAPKAAVLTAPDGTYYVNKVIDPKKGKTSKVKVNIGMLGDGNMLEITSGLTEGDNIALDK